MRDRVPVVVDASAVVKWYVPEADHEPARSIRDAYLDGDVDLLAPALLPFEVVNALRYAGLFDDDQLESVAETLPEYGIDLVPFHRLGPVAGLAAEADVTVYDASYLALAASREYTLFTADEQLLAATDGIDDGPRVEHVRDAPDVDLAG